jgi:HPt (histidine-containing phosphotransfer) domain-containing protein
MLKLRSLSHKLKEVSHSIGALKLFSLCQEFDISINHEPMVDTTLLFGELKSELNIVIRSIKDNFDV